MARYIAADPLAQNFISARRSCLRGHMGALASAPWFIEGHPNQSMPFWVQALLGIFLCFWLGIIYERSQSIPLCMFFHGFVNVLLSSFVLKFNWILILGIVLTTCAAIALWLFDLKAKREVLQNNRPTNDK